MNEKVLMEFTRSDVFTLFNSLIVREKSLFVRQNKEWELLLNQLWKEVSDRAKYECLWNKSFRELMDSWKIHYQEDLKRLDIPENIEDEEE